MEKDKINIPIFKVDDDMLPFVVIDFIGMDGKKHSALMLMDSGSSINFLTIEMASIINEDDMLPDEADEIITVTNEKTKAECAMFLFGMGERQYKEKFFIFRDQHIMDMGKKMFVGVIGNQFMQKYDLAIDYCKQTVHTSEMLGANWEIEGFSFYYPMDFGLKYYNVPVLSINHNGNTIYALADSGCDSNVISEEALSKLGIECSYSDDSKTINGAAGNTEAKETDIEISLLSIRVKDTDIITFHDHFMVTSHSFNLAEESECDENGIKIPPVGALLGSSFMAKQGLILDFGTKIIYKQRTGILETND